MPKCNLCERGPMGIEGHQDLFAYRLDARHMQFRCRVCGTVWERQPGSGTTLRWCEPTGAESRGLGLPGRDAPRLA